MRTDLTTAFQAEMVKSGRAPLMALKFFFASGTVIVSDRVWEIESGVFTDIAVADWGTISDVQDINAAIRGDGLPTRTANVTLINHSPNPFSENFNDEPPENIRVELYQSFVGLSFADVLIVDSFVIQDPITYGESDYLLSIDLLSYNQYSNPHIGTLDPYTNNFFGVFIGRVLDAPGELYGVNPLAQVITAVEIGATTIECDRELADVGFDYSGFIHIDDDLISYAGLSGNSFLNCAGVGVAHDVGTYVQKQGHDYVYAFGSCPVDGVGNLYINGEIYTGPYTVSCEDGVLLVTFPGSLPYQEITTEEIPAGTYTYRRYTGPQGLLSPGGDDGGGYTDWSNQWPNKVEYSNNADGASFVGLEYFGQPLIENTICNIEVKGLADVLPSSATFVSGFAKMYANVIRNGSKYSGFTTVGSLPELERSGAGGSNSGDVQVALASLAEASGPTIINFWATGDIPHDDQNIGVCYYFFVEVTYNLAEDVPGFTEKTYYDTGLTLDIGDDGLSDCGVNCADAIESVYDKIGVDVDPDSFLVAHDWYIANDYCFNGFIPGETRCQEVIKDMLFQCRSRIVNNADKIMLHVRQNLGDKTNRATFTTANTQLRSITCNRQPVADVVNTITSRYNKIDPDGDFLATYTAEDSGSVSKFGVYDQVYDFYLITDYDMTKSVTDFFLARGSYPYFAISFSVYFNGFAVELGDKITLDADFSNWGIFEADIVTINRISGSLRNEQITLFELLVKTTYPLTVLSGLAANPAGISYGS